MSLKARSIHGNNKRYFLSTLLHRDLLRWQTVYIHLSSESLAVLLNWLDTFTLSYLKNGRKQINIRCSQICSYCGKIYVEKLKRGGEIGVKGGKVCYLVNSYQFHILYHDLLLYLMPEKNESCFSRTMCECIRYLWLYYKISRGEHLSYFSGVEKIDIDQGVFRDHKHFSFLTHITKLKQF